MRIIKKFTNLVIAAFLVIALLPSGRTVLAQSVSPSYKVEETFFGTGGELEACSTGPTGYCSKQSAGELGVGNTASSTYQAQGGFNTTDKPYLEFTVSGGTIDLGNLSSTSTKTGTSTFSVKNYLSSGYIVTAMGPSPTNQKGSQIGALASAVASSTGTAQFGLNLVANTSPATFGANPAQIPDSTFSFGTAASGYNTPNLFKYVVGDTIAQSVKSSGQTNYTLSYIVNISPITPNGAYTTEQVFVATGTF